MWINQICGVYIFNRHGKSFLIFGSDDSNSNALRIGQTTALIFIADRTMICCMNIFLYSTIYCFDSLASLASLSCFQHKVVLTACRVGEGAYLLITYSFFYMYASSLAFAVCRFLVYVVYYLMWYLSVFVQHLWLVWSSRVRFRAQNSI